MKLAPLEVGAATVLRALDQRVTVAARVLLGRETRPDPIPGLHAARLLPELVSAAGPRPGPRTWLLLVAVSGAFPLATEVERLARRIELDSPDDVAFDLLGRLHAQGNAFNPAMTMAMVSDRVVVDVDFCARNDTNTGIQRVTRTILPRWAQEHDTQPVAHTDGHSAFRTINERENARVFEFGEAFESTGAAPHEPMIVVPWQTTVLLPEVPHVHTQRRLACLAQYSGNTVGAIGYDMIPITSGHLRPLGEGGHFAQYLAAIKHSHRVAGISRSATAEFEGFKQMLVAQGLAGPEVAEVELAEDVPARNLAPARSNDRPVVLIPGRRELHKNVRACVQAAHRLWVEGLDFEVVTLGGAGWSEGVLEQTVKHLKDEGYPLTTLGWVTDDEMWQRIHDASFIVFASLHEGYGLPISEALNLGTPVVTANYGSQSEIGERGGCLLVDPRSDTAIADAMRTLITQPDRLTALRAEIGRRPRRTWDTYATELWSFLVDGKEPRS